ACYGNDRGARAERRVRIRPKARGRREFARKAIAKHGLVLRARSRSGASIGRLSAMPKKHRSRLAKLEAPAQAETRPTRCRPAPSSGGPLRAMANRSRR